MPWLRDYGNGYKYINLYGRMVFFRDDREGAMFYLLPALYVEPALYGQINLRLVFGNCGIGVVLRRGKTSCKIRQKEE